MDGSILHRRRTLVLKLPVMLMWWAVMVALKIPTAALGFVVVPFLERYRFVPYDQLPGWTRPWSNPEDWFGGTRNYAGSLPTWWADEKGHGLWSFYRYHAIRNPANGLRSFEWLDLDMRPEKIRYVTDQYRRFYEPWHSREPWQWYLAWQGFKLGVKLLHPWNEDRHLVIKFGWRIEPRDADEHDPDPDDHRMIAGAGFAYKFQVYREG